MDCCSPVWQRTCQLHTIMWHPYVHSNSRVAIYQQLVSKAAAAAVQGTAQQHSNTFHTCCSLRLAAVLRVFKNL